MTIPSPTSAPTGLEATQQKRPWRATLRTILAVAIPGILLLPTVFEILVEELGGQLPPRATEWLILAGAFVTAIAAIITRILALAPVELFLRSLPGAPFAAQPRPKPPTNDEAGRLDRPAAVAIIAVAAIVLVTLWAIGVFR